MWLSVVASRSSFSRGTNTEICGMFVRQCSASPSVVDLFPRTSICRISRTLSVVTHLLLLLLLLLLLWLLSLHLLNQPTFLKLLQVKLSKPLVTITMTMRLLIICGQKQPHSQNSKRKGKRKNTNTRRRTFKQYYIHEIQSDIYIHIHIIQHVFHMCSYPILDNKVYL